MSQLSNDPSEPTPEVVDAEAAEAALIEGELLVEDVSIDGMCGVY